jgi:hypothetical protein
MKIYGNRLRRRTGTCVERLDGEVQNEKKFLKIRARISSGCAAGLYMHS